MSSERMIMCAALAEYAQKLDLLAERQAFEEWYVSLGFSPEVEHHDSLLGYGEFTSARNFDRWLSWLARAALDCDEAVPYEQQMESQQRRLSLTNDHADIRETNFWRDGFREPHLSLRNETLRLLLPSSHAERFYTDMKSAKYIRISPSRQSRLPGAIDIEFVDGSGPRFSCVIHPGTYGASVPPDGEFPLVVYLGNLDDRLLFPAIVRLEIAKDEPYFIQVQQNNNIWRPCCRPEVGSRLFSVLDQHLPGFIQGKTIQIHFGASIYVLHMEWVSLDALGCVVFHSNDELDAHPLVRFAIALSKNAVRLAWQELQCQGVMPNAPVIISRILPAFRAEDNDNFLMLAELERVIAWGWHDFVRDHAGLLRQLIRPQTL